MKKHVGKLLSFVLAVAMVLAMAVVPAFATDDTTTTATTYNLTINNTTVGHEYYVYQICTGTISGTSPNYVLSDVKYGSNYSGKTAGDPVPESELTALKSKTGDAAAASFTTSGDALKVVASSATSTVIGGLVPGYYLVKETSTSTPDGEAMSKLILQVVGDTSVNVKSGTTTSQKKVKDVNDSAASSATNPTDWQDSADYDIGDDVPFQLKATVASDYDNYTHGYTLKFHDKESAGLQFNASSVVVKVDGKTITTGYTVVSTGLTDKCTFEVQFSNLKDITSVKAGSEITVEYTAKLTGDAVVIGGDGNPNESHITYTNNPNDIQHGDNGKTPDDKVVVFTYKLTANKVDEEGKALKGAGFTLYKKNANGEYVAVGSEIKGEELTTFTWKGVDDGDYKLVETTTPAGYNTITPVEFTISAKHDVTSDDPKLTELTGEVTSGNAEFAHDTNTGSLTTYIENKKGSILPSTGGRGTTMIYIIGAVLVVMAGVVLAVRKKMSSKES